MKGKQYTQEFKDEAVRLALSEEQSIPKLAERLGVGLSTLNKWIRVHRTQHAEGVEDLAREKALLAEIKDLKKQLAKSKGVEAILKKAMVYFSREA